jgi:DNA primase
MRIPQEKIEEVRTASDIVDVVSAHVRLKKRGKNYLGLCPFHTEKTPSFSVSPEKQMYHCFGCGVGGNVFTFLMELDKVSFVEAVRTLADRAGITIPAATSADLSQETENEALYNACRIAGRFFFENLTSTTEGKLALEYFYHRGFTEETIRKFGLGYSLNAWDSLIRKAESEGLDLQVLEKAGLLVRREDGSGYYDRFRGRAMFPIFSTSGRVIGFGARKLREEDPLGKYINSPETPIYNKSRVLYGLSFAKEAIRETEFAVLVEGYVDLITVYQAGIYNVVASSGTALTEEQIQLIGHYGKSITVVYDADTAGSNATARGIDLIIEQGLDVKVAELPAGEDPDSFIRKSGHESFNRVLEAGVSFFDYKARIFLSQGLLETPEGQATAVRSLVGTLAKMKDELKRAFYIRKLSETYGLYESVLYRELETILGRERSRSQARPSPGFASSPPQPTQTAQVYHPGTEIPAAERDLLKLLLEYGKEMLDIVLGHFEPDKFEHPEARRLARLILDHAERGLDWRPDALINEIEDSALKRLIADLVFSKYEISKGWGERDALPDEVDPLFIAERSVVALRKRELDKQITQNQQRMKQAAALGKDPRSFLEEHQSLLIQRKEADLLKLSSPSQPPPTEPGPLEEEF